MCKQVCTGEKRKEKGIYVHPRRTGVVKSREVQPGNRGKRLN